MHQLSSKKNIFFNDLFEATCISCFCRYLSAEIPEYEIFSHQSWELKLFLEGVLSFLRSVSERQVITHKKIEKYDS